ncbi:hypothetical protein BJ912DRAFT_949665 [Pholiota molesta]|nr:hypothetical protein BJ912DRAFT_949665 [Pholiota molesta]
MKSFFASLSVVASLAAVVSAQTFTINSIQNVVVCEPTLITWTGGQAPYFLSILPAGQPNASPLVDLGQQNGSSVTWLANLGVGTSGFLDLRDNTGVLAQSGTFTVLTGSNTTCVGQPVSLSAGAAATTAATGASTNAPAPASTTTGTASSGSTGTTKTTGTTTGATTKPTSAAISKYATAGAAVMFGSAILGLAL